MLVPLTRLLNLDWLIESHCPSDKTNYLSQPLFLLGHITEYFFMRRYKCNAELKIIIKISRIARNSMVVISPSYT